MIFVTTPALLMQGDIVDIILAVLSAGSGVWFGTVAFMGYFARAMGGLVRTGFLLAAIALLIPANAFPGAGWVEIAGAVLAAALVAAQTVGRRA